MSEDVLVAMFWISTLAVLPFWFGIIFLPLRSITMRMAQSPLFFLLPALAHTAFIVMLLLSRPDLKGDYSALFPLTPNILLQKMAEPDIVTVSWLHMLPADLFIGQWIFLDSRRHNISSWLVSPVLFLTSTSGSIGFVFYLVMRVLIFTLKSRLTGDIQSG